MSKMFFNLLPMEVCEWPWHPHVSHFLAVVTPTDDYHTKSENLFYFLDCHSGASTHPRLAKV